MNGAFRGMSSACKIVVRLEHLCISLLAFAARCANWYRKQADLKQPGPEGIRTGLCHEACRGSHGMFLQSFGVSMQRSVFMPCGHSWQPVRAAATGEWP